MTNTNSNINRVFAENLTYYMAVRGKSQIDVAKALDVATSSVSYWCRGIKIPRADKLAALCHVLNISMSDLINERPARTEADIVFDKYAETMAHFAQLPETDRDNIAAMIERLYAYYKELNNGK